jgi:hypothetical protein
MSKFASKHQEPECLSFDDDETSECGSELRTVPMHLVVASNEGNHLISGRCQCGAGWNMKNSQAEHLINGSGRF